MDLDFLSTWPLSPDSWRYVSLEHLILTTFPSPYLLSRHRHFSRRLHPHNILSSSWYPSFVLDSVRWHFFPVLVCDNTSVQPHADTLQTVNYSSILSTIQHKQRQENDKGTYGMAIRLRPFHRIVKSFLLLSNSEIMEHLSAWALYPECASQLHNFKFQHHQRFVPACYSIILLEGSSNQSKTTPGAHVYLCMRLYVSWKTPEYCWSWTMLMHFSISITSIIRLKALNTNLSGPPEDQPGKFWCGAVLHSTWHLAFSLCNMTMFTNCWSHSQRSGYCPLVRARNQHRHYLRLCPCAQSLRLPSHPPQRRQSALWLRKRPQYISKRKEPGSRKHVRRWWV